MSKITYIYRLIHIDNLSICLKRDGLYAPNATPDDGLVYRTIHNEKLQTKRHNRIIPSGPGGVIHDYVSFYFGTHSPMLLQLHTGQVPGYHEGQEPIIYLVSRLEDVVASGSRFVFSDGHGVAQLTRWFDDPAELQNVDWEIVKADYWADNEDDNDRQRRKQAEFLIHQFCDWSLIRGIAVIDSDMKTRVERILEPYPTALQKRVEIMRKWYFR